MTPTQRNDIAGAIFDFAGFLTAHKEVIAVGSTASASPMVSRIQEWAEARGLSLESPNVMTWNEALAEPAPVQEQQPAPASKPVLLQCLGCERVGTQEQLSASTDCDCWLHTQPAPVQEPACKWPTRQTEKYQRDLADQIVKELIGEPPRKAVKLSDSEILTALGVEYVSSAQNRHLFLSDARTIEAAVLKANGVTE